MLYVRAHTHTYTNVLIQTNLIYVYGFKGEKNESINGEHKK